MIRLARFALVLGLLAACGGGVRVVGPPSSGTVTGGTSQLRAAIDVALARMRMTILEDQGANLLVQWGDARRGFRFNLTIQEPTYSVTLVDSVGMRQQMDPRRGEEVISSRYHRYIAKLHQLVARNIQSMGQQLPPAQPQPAPAPVFVTDPPPSDTTMVADGSCTGRLDVAAVQAVVSDQVGLVRECYVSQLGATGLQGQVTVTAVVGEDGSVGQLSVTGDTGNTTIYACVEGLAMVWQFPPPTGGACADLQVPFTL